MSADVDTCQSTQTGAVEIETYSSVSWLNRGTVPLTVTSLALAFVHRICLCAHRCFCRRRTLVSTVSTTRVSTRLTNVPCLSYQHYRVRVRVTTSNSMGEVQLACIERCCIVRATDNLMDRNSHERMMLGRRTIVEVVRPFRGHSSHKREDGSTLELHGHNSSTGTARRSQRQVQKTLLSFDFCS